jgi:Uncharacterized ACR, COG1993
MGENDRCGHQLLYEAIVLKAREMHLGEATVLRGPTRRSGHRSMIASAGFTTLPPSWTTSAALKSVTADAWNDVNTHGLASVPLPVKVVQILPARWP